LGWSSPRRRILCPSWVLCGRRPSSRDLGPTAPPTHMTIGTRRYGPHPAACGRPPSPHPGRGGGVLRTWLVCCVGWCGPHPGAHSLPCRPGDPRPSEEQGQRRCESGPPCLADKHSADDGPAPSNRTLPPVPPLCLCVSCSVFSSRVLCVSASLRRPPSLFVIRHSSSTPCAACRAGDSRARGPRRG